EKDRPEPPDELTPRLKIDDKVLKEILKGLYYPSPYVFQKIPPEILGQVYEQFLGKVIRLTPGHLAKVEEKPEVKKAGGVYYTPTYIVDYIVKHTVGRLLGEAGAENPSPDPSPKRRGEEDGIAPAQAGASSLSPLSPALPSNTLSPASSSPSPPGFAGGEGRVRGAESARAESPSPQPSPLPTPPPGRHQPHP